MVIFPACCCFFLLVIVKQNYELFYKFKTNPALLPSISFQYLVTFFIIEWFASQTKFKTVIQETEKEEIKECLTMFYAAVRREDGTEFKVSTDT